MMIISRNNQASEKRKKIESEHSSLFQKPSLNLCWGKRKIRDDSKTPTLSKDLQLKKLRIQDAQPQISADDADLKRTTEKIQGDHSLQSRKTKIHDIHKPRMDLVLAGDANLKKTTTEKTQGDHSLQSRKMKIHEIHKPRMDLVLAGDANLKRTMTETQGDHNLQSRKTKIHDTDKPSKDLDLALDLKKTRTKKIQDDRCMHHKPSEKAKNGGSVTMKQTTSAAERKRSGSIVASTEKILPEEDDWMSKGLSGFVVPGPIPDFDSFGSMEKIFSEGDEDEDEDDCTPLSEFVIPGPVPVFDSFDPITLDNFFDGI